MADILKKMVARYLLFVVYLLSFLMPRNKRKWVFGSLEDFGGNAKYLYIYISETRGDVNAIWLTRNKALAKKMQQKGIHNFLWFYSLKGIYSLLTAGVYVTTHELSKALTVWTIGRAKWVNLWHGVGVKALRFQSNAGVLNKIYQNKLLRFIFYPYGLHLFYKPDVFLSTSDMMDKHFSTSFDLNKKTIMRAGYPRCFALESYDSVVNKKLDKYELVETLDLVNKIQGFNHTYIYMPTWRKSKNEYVVEINLDFDLLQNSLENENNLFLLKLHPLMNSAISLDLSLYPNIDYIDDKADVYRLLPFVDTLITDYSSIYFDFILMANKGLVIFPFDYDDFILNSRDLAFDFDECTPGVRVYNFDELLKVIENNMQTQTDALEIVSVKEMFWNAKITTNKQLLDELQRRLC